MPTAPSPTTTHLEANCRVSHHGEYNLAEMCCGRRGRGIAASLTAPSLSAGRGTGTKTFERCTATSQDAGIAGSSKEKEDDKKKRKKQQEEARETRQTQRGLECSMAEGLADRT